MILREKTKLRSVLIGWLQQYNPADVKKGFKLFKEYPIDFDEYDEKTNTYLIDVPSESNRYLVYSVSVGVSEYVVEGECDCPAYDQTSSCKHVVAAIIGILYAETDLESEEIEQIVMKKDVKETEVLQC